MILNARHRLPTVSKPLRIEVSGDRIEIDGGALPIGSRSHRTANRASQSVVLHHVESGSAIGDRRHNRRPGLWIVADFARPKLRVLQQPRLHVAKSAREIAAESPARIAIH